MEWIEIAMKTATFLGVLVSAVVLIGGAPMRRPMTMGALGVVLMIVNAWLSALGLVLDVAYLVAAAWMAWRSLTRPPTRETTFVLVASRQA